MVKKTRPKKRNTSIDVDVTPAPHDYFIQSTLTDVKIAKDFFEQHLPADIKKMTDLNTLILCPRNFISKRFKKYEADVLYQVQIDREMAYLYLLIEAQSTIDPMLPFRIFCYMMEIMRQHVEKKKNDELPIVFPMIFYSGSRKYSGPLTFSSLFKGHEELMESILVNPLSLIDVNQISDAELKQHPYAGLVEFALKYSKTKNFIHHLKANLDILRKAVEQLGPSPFQNMLNYLIQVLGDTELAGLKDVIEHEFIVEEKEALMGTIAESWIQQGIKEGIEKEKHIIAERMLLEGADIAFIAKITLLPLAKIKEIKEKLH